jgi:DNA-binding transcriptional regulator YhcF (GntR family)
MDQPLAAFDLGVDRDDDLPLATQLAWKLKALIASGHLGPGARLPGVRDLAEMAGVNTNTVRAVYSRLDQQGLIRSEHGRGTFVAERTGEGELGRLAASAAAQAESAGLDRRELAAALYGASDLALPRPAADSPAPPPPAGSPQNPEEERRLRRRLRREISQLEGDLATLEPLSGDVGGPARRAAGRLLSAGELERVRDDLHHRVDELRRADETARDAYREARAEEERLRHEEALREAQRPRPSRVWPHAGASTLKPRAGATRVAWTTPHGW